MQWKHNIIGHLHWSGPISNLDAKREVAEKIAEHVKDGDVIGFGSGSTSFLAIQAIAERLKQRHISCTAIPTSTEVALTCMGLGIPTESLVNVKPDWAFDGADEVDPNCNLIKGRGGAMFREKLVIDSSPKTFILVDQSKLVPHLGQTFPIPIEVFPDAVNLVREALEELAATEATLRLGLKKDGPVFTENRNLIMDVRFSQIPSDLEKRIKGITGVIESGLFLGRTFEIVVPSLPRATSSS
jgi:ribose 5-phosphate isomerase A